MPELRTAATTDREAIRDLYLRSFPDEENQSVAQLALDLLDQQQNPGAFGLVVDEEGNIAGHAGFSPVVLNHCKNWSGYILSPLAVSPEFHKRGLGTALIEAGVERLREQGVNLLFVYGDPDYYGRFGFDAEIAERYPAPYTLQYPFGWQAIVLNDAPADIEGGVLSCVPALRDPALW